MQIKARLHGSRRHGRGRRRTRRYGSRVYLRLRRLAEEERRLLLDALKRELESWPGVSWVRVNVHLGNIVVHCNPAICPPEAVRDRVDELERSLGWGERPWAPDVWVAEEEAALRRAALEIAADLASLGLSTWLRKSKALRWPIDIDLAAVIALFEGIPRLRNQLELGLTRRVAELLIELGKASLHTVLRSETGPLAALLRHGLALRAAQAQRRLWREREAELCADPASHPVGAPDGLGRPVPLRPGVIERYESNAIPLALSIFGAEAVLTLNRDAAASALLGGLPRAARLGRWAFASWLVWELAERSVLVVDREAVERLDRIDDVVLPVALADFAAPGFERFVSTVRRTGRQLRVVGAAPGQEPWARESEVWRGSDAPFGVVRRLQKEGRGVLFIGEGADLAYRAADCSLALSSQGPPWGASLIGTRGWDDAALLLEGLEMAREASRQSVQFALAEAATAVSLLWGGLDRRTTHRVMASANVAFLFAVGNAIRLARSVRREPVEASSRPEPWHALSPEEVLERLESRAEGLSSTEVRQRRSRRRRLPNRRELLLRKIGAELANPMTPILAGGAVLSAIVGSLVDAALLGGALGLNAGLGGVQGYRTERAILALEEREARPTRVLRDDREQQVASSELVEGDVVLLEAGGAVPADCRILEGSSIEVDESSLTGESQPVLKQVAATPEAGLAERACMLYEGSSINVGSLRVVVVATGEHTEAGRARSEGRRREKTPGVEARLQYLSRMTVPVAGLSALAMTASGLRRRRPLEEVATSAVGLGVASVPEGLPVLATLAQLAAAERLSSWGALVRNPRALEALGRMDVLCADKTGTLTEGKIRLRMVSSGSAHRTLDALEEAQREVLRVALRATPVGNGSRLPHPTDQALVEGARRSGVTHDASVPRRAELPFDPAQGFHASVEEGAEGPVLSVKGAPEVLLPRCDRVRGDGIEEELDEPARRRWLDRAEELAARGYRVLAVAERQVDDDFELDEEQVARLVLRGFLGYADPLRESAREALARLERAGVRVVMITGDHPGTAESIAEELGILNGHRVVTGAELDELPDAELKERIEEVAVFARVAPLQKVRIVRLLQASGHAVGMTGDGANDAPAIQLADVGIALGERSTSAARTAADLIVSDGQIETIMQAVLEGRALWTRVRDAVSILVGGNLGEIAFTVAGGLRRGRSPLNARQLLLVNLLTDTLPALAIAVRPPRHQSAESLMSAGPELSLGAELERDMLLRGAVTASAAALAAWMARRRGASEDVVGTVALLTLTGTQLGQTLVSGGRSVPVVAASLGSLAVLLAAIQTPKVSQFFGCRPLGPWGLTQALVVTGLASGAARVASRALLETGPDGSRAERTTRRIGGALRQKVPGRLDFVQAAADVTRSVQRLTPRRRPGPDGPLGARAG